MATRFQTFQVDADTWETFDTGDADQLAAMQTLLASGEFLIGPLDVRITDETVIPDPEVVDVGSTEPTTPDSWLTVASEVGPLLPGVWTDGTIQGYDYTASGAEVVCKLCGHRQTGDAQALLDKHCRVAHPS